MPPGAFTLLESAMTAPTWEASDLWQSLKGAMAVMQVSAHCCWDNTLRAGITCDLHGVRAFRIGPFTGKCNRVSWTYDFF